MIGVLLGVNLGYAFAVSPKFRADICPSLAINLEIVGLAYGLSLLATFKLFETGGARILGRSAISEYPEDRTLSRIYHPGPR